ncbi:efflux RND transporter permease subunit [Limimaricola hongkongensis]|uniref:RND multidrug efflux transporter/ Acriflavin resistance protein n=1 Tax=Limimaricola hongkongensis DSM 17492 TaxID=1122180 RepID=A0A017H964_9RHOB|nr:efflux RND transporter permease subunit [Limimaricola hongkongensis]EYD70916.1 RND multidrug efflux transporter/ Acriflavin resistance protein [Limimaricola hongkongensis DSM 17492]
MAGGAGPAGGILSYFTRHPTAANLVLALMIVAGVLAFPNMRAQYFPDIVIDRISVSAQWEGAGAEDVDTGIVQVLEPALRAVDGVTGSEATAAEGRASVSLDFAPGHDMDRAEKDVAAAIDGVTGLPDGVETPDLRRASWSDRVTDLVLTGPVPLDRLGRIADETVAQLFAAGVTQATVQGFAAPQTLVEVPTLSLIRHDLSLSQIAAAVAREARADPAGEVSGAARLRTGQPARDPEEIAAIVLRQEADGGSLRLGEVAAIRPLGPERDRAYFVGDDAALLIRVDRSAAGDAIGLQREVETVAREMRAGLPEGVTLQLTNSQAERISGRLALLLDNGLTGLALVLALLFLFLNARTAIWVALGLPVSMFAALALMQAFGLTLNMISLFALILTLGIVVDDAIVVGEHADWRARRLGEDPATAAERAARRMFLPVFCATLTTIIAFWGLVLIGGRFGDLIRDIPVTVILVLAASLVECFVVLPNHLSHAAAGAARRRWYDWPSRQVDRGFRLIRERGFRPLMTFAIRARYAVVAGAILALSSQVALVVSGDVQWRFFSAPERGSVTGNFAMLPSATRADGMAQLREMQRAADAVAARIEAETGVNPVSSVLGQIGGNAGRGLSGIEDREPWQIGGLSVELIEADLRPVSSGEFLAALQSEIVTLPSAETISFRSWGSGPGGDAIDIQLSGAQAETLKRAAEALKARLATYPEVSGLEDSLPWDKEEIGLTLTARGRALGFDIDALGAELRDRLGGIEAASYPVGAREATIRVELPEDEIAADFLDRTLLRSAAGDWLPLADIVTVERRDGFSTLRRENGVLLVSVNGGLDDADPDRATAVMTAIEDEILPGIEARFGVQTALSGLSEQEDEFLGDAQVALILCLTGIYLVLAWIFGSWSRPLVVMSIVPFGLVGAIWGHAWWGIPLSMFSVVGLIGMVGIVINDSIVLVTTIDEHARDRGLVPSVIDGTCERLRPVFLTTATTVLGLSPLLYEGSAQAQFLKPTVVTLVYGLGFGFVLVLFVVPALVVIGADIGRMIRSARRLLRRGLWAGWLGAGLCAALFAVLLGPPLIGAAPVVAGLPGGFWGALPVYAGLTGAGLAALFVLAAMRRGAARRS